LTQVNVPSRRANQTRGRLRVYRPLYNQTDWWVRPQAVFFETVMIDGASSARSEWAGDG
jgi:hypothetical protein